MPEIGKEYAVYVERTSPSRFSGICKEGCCEEDEHETFARINTDLDDDEELIILVKGAHPDLQGVHIVTPLHKYNDDSRNPAYYYRLVTE